MKDINKNIVINIKNYMDIFGINQRELAKKLRCSNSTVSMWLSGNATPRMEKIDKMCLIFGCNREDLISDKPKSAAEARQAQVTKTFVRKFLKLSPEDQLDLLTYMEDHYRND